MKRYALCIENDEYQILPKLSCAVADAKAIAEKLGHLGFDVDTALNLGRDELNSKIVSLSDKADEYDAVLRYIIILDACRSTLGIRGRGNNFFPMIAPQGSVV